MPESELLTAREAAHRIGVSVRTVCRMADDGRLEPANRKGLLLFAAETVEAQRDKEMAKYHKRFAS